MYEVPLADLPVAPAGEQNAPGLTVAIVASCVGVGVGVGVGVAIAIGVGVADTVGVLVATGVGLATGEVVGDGVGVGKTEIVGLGFAAGVELATGALEATGLGEVCEGLPVSDWYLYPDSAMTGVSVNLQFSK